MPGSAASVLPAASHLAELCDRDDLERLRVGTYQDDPLRGWNHQRINTGLAHGVTGVAAALRAACEVTGSPATLAGPLRRVCRWLLERSYVDAWDVVTWTPGDHAPGTAGPIAGSRHAGHGDPRQAWCYGTPGVAWTLWEAGRVLGDPAPQRFAEHAMRSFCRAFQERRYLGGDPPEEQLAVCHGAAGTLAVADAFARHAALEEAAVLADRLEAHLRARLGELRAWPPGAMSLLGGASGVLAVLLTREGGARQWLAPIALR